MKRTYLPSRAWSPISLILISILMFTSCEDKSVRHFTIGVSQCSDDNWRNQANMEMMREASFYENLTIVIRSADDNTQQQIKDIDAFLEEGVDALIVAPNESSALTEVVEKVYKSGIPVILYDRKIDSEEYNAYVGADNYSLAYSLGKYTASVLDGKGNIVVIRGLKGAAADEERYLGFVDAIADYPELKIIDERYGDFLYSTGKAKMDSVILGQSDRVDLVFAMNDEMARGVYESYNGKDIDGRPYIIGIDGLGTDNGGVEMVDKGMIDATFIYPTGGEKVIEICKNILEHKSFNKNTFLPTAVIDESNVHTIKLQTDQIINLQSSFDRLNSTMKTKMKAAELQKRLLIIIAVALFLLAIIGAYALYLAKSRKNMNEKLLSQNQDIIKQVGALEQQKQHIIEISQQLTEATNSKLVFFTNISHEFKTPLSLILSPVETLINNKNLTKEQKNLLALVQRNGKRLLSLIMQLLEFRTYENSKVPILYSYIRLDMFLYDFNGYFSDLVLRKHVKFDFRCNQNSDFLCWIDKGKVEKIYFNLLSNAFKHVNVGGGINVNLGLENNAAGEEVRLTVHNTGSYVAPEHISSIFDRFYKISNSDNNTGIGLAFTNSLVNTLKGSIHVESSIEAGTAFSVVLPIKRKLDPADAVDDTQSAGYFDSQMPTLEFEEDSLKPEVSLNPDRNTILLIEDNPDMRQYISLVLGDEYNILEARNGDEGLKIGIKHIPDLILCDIMMPKKNGFAVCREFKDNPSTIHIPIIMLTACSLEEQKAASFESGADGFIQKPFNVNTFKIRIRKCIEGRQEIVRLLGDDIVSRKKTTIADAELQFLNKFKQYIIDHMQEGNITVDDIAAYMGMSRANLYRKIKTISDISPNDIINQIKLKYAINLLQTQQKNISEVAFMTGFSSASYFAKIFKKYYNESPNDFLKRVSSMKGQE